MPLNIPNILTSMRVLLIPVIAMVFYMDFPYARQVAAGLFLLTAITDALDGYLARKWNQMSKFGAFLDPVADKLSVAVALLLILQADPRVAVAVPVGIIICREITISALREWMAELGKRATVAVSVVGKFKTIAQMSALVAMMIEIDIWFLPTYELGFYALWFAAGLTLWSMMAYLKAAWPELQED